jgi:hypothetical protein
MRFGQRCIPINCVRQLRHTASEGFSCCLRFRQGSPKPRPHPCLVQHASAPAKRARQGFFFLTTATCVDEQGSFSSLFVPLDDPRAVPETRRSFAPILLKLALDAGASGFLNLSQSRDRPLMQIARAVSLGSSPAQQGPRGGNYGDHANPYRHVERELYVHVWGHAGYSNKLQVMAF